MHSKNYIFRFAKTTYVLEQRKYIQKLKCLIPIPIPIPYSFLNDPSPISYLQVPYPTAQTPP